ncbi:FHA domain-containing protein [Planctopirus hydrillae]|uniref:FHA domain-containing protein n=1 Tax=Planctopirus hydrillae TaxID=1841610 RepID=A0A1C3EN63_9PLAN|nr:FHA domain-containing protein [Planctopirus hydrillae]ODA34686.1 hypothetical protein A6X21_03155 [Planctopirus hydrillae]
MADFLIRTGSSTGRKLSLPARELIVGRDDKADIRLNSSLVSRRHCRILPGTILRPGVETVIVEDLKSQNGTFVNEVPISAPTTLEPGDRLRIGAMIFELAGAESTGSRTSTSDPVAARTGFARPPATAAPSESDITDWLSLPAGQKPGQPGASPNRYGLDLPGHDLQGQDLSGKDLSGQDTAEIGVEVLDAVRKSLEARSPSSLRDDAEISSVTTAPASDDSPQLVPSALSGEAALPPNEWTSQAARIIQQYWKNTTPGS